MPTPPESSRPKIREPTAKLSNLVTFEGGGIKTDPSAPIAFWGPSQSAPPTGAISCPEPQNPTAVLVENLSGPDWGLELQQEPPPGGIHQVTMVLGETTSPDTEITITYDINTPDLKTGESPQEGMLPGFSLMLLEEGGKGLTVLGIPLSAPTKNWTRIPIDPVTVKKPGLIGLSFYFTAAAGRVEIRNIKIISKAKSPSGGSKPQGRKR